MVAQVEMLQVRLENVTHGEHTCVLSKRLSDEVEHLKQVNLNLSSLNVDLQHILGKKK